jgi:hypothetical protein
MRHGFGMWRRSTSQVFPPFRSRAGARAADCQSACSSSRPHGVRNCCWLSLFGSRTRPAGTRSIRVSDPRDAAPIGSSPHRSRILALCGWLAFLRDPGLTTHSGVKTMSSTLQDDGDHRRPPGRVHLATSHSCKYRRLHALASASQTVGARIQRAYQVACVAAEEPW